MRVMVIIRATPDSESGAMPGPELLEAMGAFNQKLVEAGVMLDGAGLRAASEGARVSFDGPDRTVRRGPFTPAEQQIAGYWIWNVTDLDEAIAWADNCPHPHPGHATEIEIRPLFEESDFVQG